MVCESMSAVLENLKEKGILGEYNAVLNKSEFNKFKVEFDRYISITYPKLNLNNESFFNDSYIVNTKYPRTSAYYRDDIQTTEYAQPNSDLFEELDIVRTEIDLKDDDIIVSDVKSETKEESDTEPIVVDKKDDNIDPITDQYSFSFMRENAKLNRIFADRTRSAMISFMEGLNIDVNILDGEIIPLARRTYIDENGKSVVKEDPLAAFDLLQKFLAIKSNISTKDMSLQTANVILSFIGKKSKLGIELWKGIDNWKDYKKVYDKYNTQSRKINNADKEDVDFSFEQDEDYTISSPYLEGDMVDKVLKEAYTYDPTRFNPYAHKQAIIEFIAEMLQFGLTNNYIGEKRNNPDISREYFESLGYKDKYAQNWFIKMLNRFYNWLQANIFGNKAITIYSRDELTDVVLDIVDDVYKKNYNKFIRNYYQDTNTGEFFDKKGQKFEQKFYEKSLAKDPYAKYIIDTLFDSPLDYYRLSGSLVLRKYGRVLRALSEDLHDIDGIITLDQFRKEKNSEEFLNWIKTVGLPLSKKRTDANSKKFLKEIVPYLEDQEWYKDIKNKFPSWNLEVAFIGKDHKNGESITISGYIEHPTETVLVKNADGSASSNFFKESDNGKVLPKRYVLDFFLRTDEGKYPLVFDNYFLDWKQIFEAKINMGRGKDLADLIYFEPFREDNYKFTNKGFRYFTFAEDAFTSMPEQKEIKIDEKEIKNQRAKEAADALGQKIAQALGVNYMNISSDQAKQILESRKKKYNGEPAFYFAGTVYIVGDNVNFDTVLHELSHPLLRVISKENPKLFNNLYNSLMATKEGEFIKEHVLKNYPELKEEDTLFKEEALAYALQIKAVNKVTDEIESKGFESFISRLLTALKDLLKMIFGKVSVANIKVDTTIDKLADMLLDKSFKYETDLLTNDDMVGYAREIKEMAQSLLKNVSAEKIQDNINDLYSTNQLIYDKVQNYNTRSPIYQKMIREAFFIKGTKELLPKIAKSLSGYQTITSKKNISIEDIIKDVIQIERLKNEELTNKSRSLINSVTVVNNISQNIYNDLNSMQKTKSYSSRDAVALLFLYRSSIRSWNDMFESFDESLAEQEDYDITQQNDFTDLINETKNNLLRADKKIRDIYKENSIDIYVEITGYMNDFLKEQLEKNLKNSLTSKLSENQISDLYRGIITQSFSEEDLNNLYQEYDKKGIQSKYVKKFIDEYKEFLINQDKITDGLSGKLKDVSWFNRFFESYTSSNDPIVGGLAIFINDQKTEANQRALEKSYEFRNRLEPLLDKIGFNSMKTRQVLDMVMFKDKVLFMDPKTKLPVEKEVYTFLNDFGNGWRYELDLLEYNVDEAFAGEDLDKQTAAVSALEQFKRDYMNDEYLNEVYNKNSIFEKYGDIGARASLVRTMALDAYNNEANELSDELERFQKYSTLQELWRDYKNLYSYKYSDGTSKVDDPENDIYDLSITKILLEYRASTSDYYEFIPRLGSLQTSFDEFLNMKDSEDITADEFNKAKDEWLKQNLKISYTQEFYDSRKKYSDQIRKLQAKINSVIGESFDISNAFDEIYNLMYAYKDEQGQPIPEELGRDKIKMIKEINQKIIDYKAKFDSKTGLSIEESEELNMFIAINKRDPSRISAEQKLRFKDLLRKQSKTGLTVAELAILQNAYSELASLTQKIPTEYYVDAFNDHLQRLNVSTITVDQLDTFINSDEVKNLLSSDGRFADWFRDNHVFRKVFNKKTRKQQVKFERTMVNSLSVPKNDSYYEKTELFNPITGEPEIHKGLPNSRHSVYTIKDKYRTGYNPNTNEVELEVGVHIDNKGDFLPKLFIPGDLQNSAKDEKYINKEYQRLKQQPNSARFQLLETMKEFHLKYQETKSNRSKLYLDMPRYVLRDNLSRIQSGALGDRYKQIKKGIKQSLQDAWGKSVDEGELEHNYQRDNNLEDYKLINTDLNSEEISYIPVTGLYNLDTTNTDPDVIGGMFKYLLSLEQQDQLLKTLPLVNSILETLDDPKNAPKTQNTFSKTIKKIKGKLQHTVKPGATNNRLGQVRSLMEREYYGKQYTGENSGVYLDKFISKLQKLSSRASLAINLPSDLKNRYGQILQNLIEASGGDMITIKDLAKARLWAATAMLEWSSKSIYSKGVPALSSQLIEMFDSAFKFQDDFGRSISRNFAKDMANGEWMYNIRKNLEMEASLQLFGAFLNGQKVEQKLSNGKTIIINYKDAWVINKTTKIAELKPGIDPAYSNKIIYHNYVKGETLDELANMYNVTVDELLSRNNITNIVELEDGQELIIAKSEKFKLFKNKFQGVSHKLYGAYDKFAQAEGNMYLPYRMFTFMRKWFIPMFTNRLGASVEIEDGKWWKPKLKKRYNWMTGKTTIGFYLNAFVGLTELIKSKGKYWAYMDGQQKADLMKTLSESLYIIVMGLITSMFFGYDPDDKKRFAKMRARSGALGTDEFKTWGFIQNHILLLTLGTQAETSAFIPIPSLMGVNLGADDYIKMATTTTSAFGNTVTLYAKIFEDVYKLVTFNEKAYYSRKEGEYFWQDKDAPKVIGHLLKTVGVNGNFGQVDKALEGFESASKLK